MAGVLLFVVPSIQDHAVCVRHWDWSETSQTVSLMTREHGLIRCIAKGSKREKSAFSGGLEIATMGHMVAIVKPSTDLALLTSWDLIEPMHLIRHSLERYQACMFVIDLIPRMINDHDPHPGIYDALIGTLMELTDLDSCSSLDQIHAQLAWYLWQLLEHTGAKPELMVDVFTGKSLDEDAQIFGFSPEHGGVVTDPKGDDHRPEFHELSDAWRVRRTTVELLRCLHSGDVPADFEHVSVEQMGRVGGLLAAYIRAMIGSDVPSLRLIYPSV